MAITIDWPNKVINVPRADLTLIQSVPTEIRKMDLNWFRLSLKALEDDELGMPYPDTHRHNTEVEISGLTLARVIEIINGYTVTFENGLYAVNLVGANSNVADVVNVNNVSVRSANSAGMVSSPAIEYSSFNGGVTIDVINGVTGTAYPIGTPQRPVNNLAEAVLIAEYRGLNTFYVIGDININTGGDYRGKAFVGESISKSLITVSPPAQVSGCEFMETSLTGTLDGECTIKDCSISDLSGVSGVIEMTIIDAGTVTLGQGNQAHFLDCWSGVPGVSTPAIDLNGSGTSLAMRNYNGGVLLQNKTGAEAVSLDLNSGQIRIDLTTVTEGQIVARGIGKCVDDSTGDHIPTGMYGNLSVLNEAISQGTMSSAILDASFVDHQDPNTIGITLSTLPYGEIVHVDLVGGSPGQVYPAGTHHAPVNSLTDAYAIIAKYGCTSIHCMSDITLTAGDDISGVTLFGTNQGVTVTCTNVPCTGTTFDNVVVTGSMSGRATYKHCYLDNLTGVAGFIENCQVSGDIHLVSGIPNETLMYNCTGVDLTGPIIHINGATLIATGTSGRFTLADLTSGVLGFGGDFCQVVLDPSCTGGVVAIGTHGTVYDNSNGSVVGLQNSLTTISISAAVWAQVTEAGYSFEDLMQINASVLAGKVSGAGTGTEVFKGIDGVTDRVVSTVDVNGNRTAVVLDVS